MLWIEYESKARLEVPAVQDVLNSLAKLISPFPVCAYDRGGYSVGLLVHDGILPDASEGHVGQEFSPGYEVSNREDNDGSSASSLDFLSSNSDSSITSTDRHADLIPIPQSLPNEASDTSNDLNLTSTSNGGGSNQNISEQSNLSQMPNNTNRANRGEDDAGGDDDDDDDQSEDSIRVSGPTDIPAFDTFAGTTHLRLNKLRQDLDISFDLRIQPTRKSGVVDCAISIDNCVVRAGDMYDDPPTTDWQDPQLPCYVSQRTTITFSPSGNCRVAKNAYPLWPNYAERNTINIGKRVEGNIEASANPKAGFKIGASKNQIVDQIPATLAITPRKIGSGSRRDFRWDYAVTRQAETYLELSSDHPPMHRATFPVEVDSDTPSNLKVRVDVVYSKRHIESRSIWPGSALIGFLTDVGVKHIVMTVEATICKENGDYFKFPSETKRGCVMEMDLEFQGRKFGHGPPLQRSVGEGGTARLLHSKSNGKKKVL